MRDHTALLGNKNSQWAAKIVTRVKKYFQWMIKMVSLGNKNSQ